jgi:hypothetical protein
MCSSPLARSPSTRSRAVARERCRNWAKQSCRVERHPWPRSWNGTVLSVGVIERDNAELVEAAIAVLDGGE